MLATNTLCDVVDQIIPWTDQNGALNIGEGDLVLQDGRFEQVSDIRVAAGTQTVAGLDTAQRITDDTA